MKKSVEYYISELLFLHDCIIIPEFGGFVCNKKSAQLNKKTGILNPPSKQILFNPNLKTNDGLLIAHIALKEGITQENAQKNVKTFAKECSDKLSSTRILRIKKVGLFTSGQEGNVTFSQDLATNYSLYNFGMQPTSFKLIQRKTDTIKKAENTIHKIKKPSSLVLRAAAVIIPLIMISYLSMTQQEKIKNIYLEMATFNPFYSSEKIETPIIKIPKQEIDVKINTVLIEPKDTKPTIISKKTYYIIAGAFTKQKNAQKMHNKLLNWNYKSEIIKESHLLRVSYESFYNREDAILVLNKIKQENPEAWLLTK